MKHLLGMSNPKDDLRSLSFVQGRSKLHIVPPSLCIFNYNYGPDRNKANKGHGRRRKCVRKIWTTAPSLAKLIIHQDHRVDCLAWICMKEIFMLDKYLAHNLVQVPGNYKCKWILDEICRGITWIPHSLMYMSPYGTNQGHVHMLQCQGQGKGHMSSRSLSLYNLVLLKSRPIELHDS